MLALLFLLNSAVCYCLSASHDHAHPGQDTEAPAPHDCDCLTTAQPLPSNQQVESTGPTLIALVEDFVAPPGFGVHLGSFSSEVRPPGEHAPPRYVLHCSLLC